MYKIDQKSSKKRSSLETRRLPKQSHNDRSLSMPSNPPLSLKSKMMIGMLEFASSPERNNVKAYFVSCYLNQPMKASPGYYITSAKSK